MTSTIFLLGPPLKQTILIFNNLYSYTYKNFICTMEFNVQIQGENHMSFLEKLEQAVGNEYLVEQKDLSEEITQKNQEQPDSNKIVFINKNDQPDSNKIVSVDA